MKRIYQITLVLVFSLGTMTSCENYLEVPPVSSFGPDYVFSNVTNATIALTGVYAALGGDNGYGIRLSMYYPLDDDILMGQGGNPFPDNERRDIAHYNVQPSNTQLRLPFNQLYTGIERANICIAEIPRMAMYSNGTEAERRELRRLHGEALTLRAQFYFELVRNWGDIPAQFEPSSTLDDLFLERTDRDIIYDRIIEDLGQAAELLPWATASSSNERITQGAARALRARIALFRGGYSLRLDRTMRRGADHRQFYQIARDEALAVINSGSHQLNPSFEAVFREGLLARRREPNQEILWEIAMTGGGSSFGDSKLGYYNGPRWNNLGNSALTILPTFFYSFDENDLRRDVSAAPYNINQDFTIVARNIQTMVDGKFRRDWMSNPVVINSNAQYFGINWPMIRYADVLLMFAEAENELNNGPTAAAIQAFEQVRTRGFGGDASLIGTTPSSYQEFFEAIVQERAFELSGEGIRKYDLIRWNLLETKLNETKANLEAMATRAGAYANLPTTMYYEAGANELRWLNSLYQPQPTTAPAGSASVAWLGNGINTTILTYFAVGFTPGKSELLPLHTSILDANSKLKQEYGY
ncbi:RagB/SusD family nutrient uptake outer membrane protein [Belliella sp. DSM 111904]|uniref:RagB/SusD family nutrient uptake outer membrane protein n=1 Tax=Belliella filtrata TaxID=2923435 RepID=A0ABS9UW57_9BACT|nr:RagB/SusD family nutrient uptake outer membrane protein [Belliella filtrata]MCH7408401.1 RagB/SusD family nutrient uptake outer membrane protein [Belliella filtrata]